MALHIQNRVRHVLNLDPKELAALRREFEKALDAPGAMPAGAEAKVAEATVKALKGQGDPLASIANFPLIAEVEWLFLDEGGEMPMFEDIKAFAKKHRAALKRGRVLPAPWEGDGCEQQANAVLAAVLVAMDTEVAAGAAAAAPFWAAAEATDDAAAATSGRTLNVRRYRAFTFAAQWLADHRQRLAEAEATRAAMAAFGAESRAADARFGAYIHRQSMDERIAQAVAQAVAAAVPQIAAALQPQAPVNGFRALSGDPGEIPEA